MLRLRATPAWHFLSRTRTTFVSATSARCKFRGREAALHAVTFSCSHGRPWRRRSRDAGIGLCCRWGGATGGGRQDSGRGVGKALFRCGLFAHDVSNMQAYMRCPKRTAAAAAAARAGSRRRRCRWWRRRNLDGVAADGVRATVLGQRRVSPGEFAFRHARCTATHNTLDASRDAAVAAGAAFAGWAGPACRGGRGRSAGLADV